jgi:hypothetical protein
MADGSAGPSAIRRLVDTAWSADVASADPDDPLVRQLWEMPKIGGYLKQFASSTQQMGHVLRD